MVADTASARARRERVDLSGERWLAPLPMFHAYVSACPTIVDVHNCTNLERSLSLIVTQGQTYYCTTAAISGCKVFIMPEYSLHKYLLYLDTYRITFLTGVPTLMVSIAKYPEATAFNLKAIESVVTGSAPLNPEIGKLVQDTYLRPGVQVKQGWGLTETTCSATGFAQDDEDDGRSIGWLNPNMRAKIVPTAGYEFTYYEGISHPPGEIWVSGPNIMKGYYKREQETTSSIVIEGGIRWFKTGDIGYVDDRGCFYIVDRMKVSNAMYNVFDNLLLTIE